MLSFLDSFAEEITIAIVVGFLLRKQTVQNTDGSWTYEGEAPFADLIRKAETDNGIPPRLLASLLFNESHFRDDIIRGETRSSVGALGIAQFMPETAVEQLGSESAALNPAAAIPGAARYLAAIKRYLDPRGGDGWRDAVIAYNWGMGNVAKWIAAGRPFLSLPLESRVYASSVYDSIYA